MRKMVCGIVRQEPWINEVLRINSRIGGIPEVEFGYSPLGEIHNEKTEGKYEKA